MARPRQFDEERAVDAAMRAFLGAGYEATSTQDLCTATGLGRSSIYNTFTSKHHLFKKSLRHYMDIRTAGIIETLEGPAPVREKIGTLMRQAVDPRDGIPRGCLVVNTMIELAPHDAEVAAMLKRDYERRLEALRAAIEAGKISGELAADRDATALAHFVIATISGIQVSLRGGAGPAAAQAVIQTALGAF
ncbi:TetR/AcrR family transcriptional regulator [Nonomuraea endophytica]|uniref:AcrR family transcriptional regulator n=1 Tax=Nonomuraea endophytica TaxID=714136 RepID=A0A7W8EIL0_9ACTN|nr:TetR/AcrR family transcriptional regulator [Nonomuraea endophytica]MBB5080724.1 AcrR family transcriptional regulator [Nonomuraea endophytica]